jgi:hypothetical protein
MELRDEITDLHPHVTTASTETEHKKGMFIDCTEHFEIDIIDSGSKINNAGSSGVSSPNLPGIEVISGATINFPTFSDEQDSNATRYQGENSSGVPSSSLPAIEMISGASINSPTFSDQQDSDTTRHQGENSSGVPSPNLSAIELISRATINSPRFLDESEISTQDTIVI